MNDRFMQRIDVAALNCYDMTGSSHDALPQASPLAEAPKLHRLLLAGLLILLTVAVYLPSLGGNFLWDDDAMISQNPAMDSPAGLRMIWTGKGGPDYYPLTLTLLWTEWQGWAENPAGYHAVSVALHAAGVVLLWLLLKRLGVSGAWWGAAIFAIHPVNVETVAWIAETKNTLSLVFYLLALLAYLRFEDRPRARTYAAALAFFALALLAKTSVAMLPCILLLLAWWRRDRVTRQDLLRSLPFFALSAALGLITLMVQKTQIVESQPGLVLGIWERCFTAGQIVWFYLGKAIFPHPLLTVYPPFASTGVLPDLALAAAFVLLWVARRKPWGRALLFAAVYFFISLVPVLGFIDSSYSVHYSLVADHYQYVALAGIAALAGAAISCLPATPYRFEIAAGAAVVAALGWATLLQEQPYKSKVALWTKQREQTPYLAIAPRLLGEALLEDNRNAEALELLEEATLIDPNEKSAHLNRGNALARLGRLDEAADQFREALRLEPRDTLARNALGGVFLNQGRGAEAGEEFRQVLRIDPEDALAQDGLGVALLSQGRIQEALVHIREAVRIRPRNSAMRDHLADALRRAQEK